MHAPEMRFTMGSGCQYDAKNKEASGEDNARPTSKLINNESKGKHAKNLADEVGIGQAGFDGRRDIIGIPNTTTS